MIRAAVVGGAGYTGGEVLRLLYGPSGDRRGAGHLGTARRQAGCVRPSPAPRATPNSASPRATRWAKPMWCSRRCTMASSSGSIDQLRACSAGGDRPRRRLPLRDAQDYPRWYGWTHPAPHLLGRRRVRARRDAPSGDRVCVADRVRGVPRDGVDPRPRAARVRRVARPGDPLSSSRRRSAHLRAERSPATRHITRIAAARSARTRRQGTAIPLKSSRSSTSATPSRVAFSATAVEAVRGVLDHRARVSER